MLQTEKKHLQARIITDCQHWNDFVANSECCNITQSYEWAELAPHLGAEAMRIGVVDEDGQICAASINHSLAPSPSTVQAKLACRREFPESPITVLPL